MKVALVHDYIKEYGGAERVLEVLHEIWPDAPVFTLVYLPEFLGPHQKRFASWDIRTSFLQHIPLKAKLISPFRLIVPFVFKTFNLSSYDVVIVSATGAYVKNFKSQISNLKSTSQNSKLALRLNTKDQRPIYVNYCHTPPRYLYGYATAREWKKNIIFRILGEIANHFLRLIDFKSAQNVDYFIANSKNVADRIKKFYRRESTVIYPPIDVFLGSPRPLNDSSDSSLAQPQNLAREDSSRISSPEDLFKSSFRGEARPASYLKSSSHGKARPAKDYFLAGGRIARPKHIDLVVKTFVKLKLPLKVFGRSFANHDSLFPSTLSSGPKGMIHNSNIEFVGEVTDEEKMELMRNAKAYIFAAEDEDFGITPVEAMSVGTPVIAYRSGGVVESIIEGKTGVFFNELTVESLTHAIQKLNDSNHFIKPEDCIQRGKKFSKERFKKEIKDFVTEKFRK